MKIGYILFAFMVMFEAAGLLLEKKGLTQFQQVANIRLLSSDTIIRVFKNPTLMLGIGCTIIGFILGLFVLSRFNLSYIQPFGAILYVLVAVLSYYILGEAISAKRLIGIGIIITGCIFINL